MTKNALATFVGHRSVLFVVFCFVLVFWFGVGLDGLIFPGFMGPGSIVVVQMWIEVVERANGGPGA